MTDAIELARDAGVLVPANGGWRAPAAPGAPAQWHVETELRAPPAGSAGAGAARLLVLGLGEGAVTARLDGEPVRLVQGAPGPAGTVWTGELAAAPPPGARVRVEASSTSGVAALWLVRRADEIPPPAPREWQAPDGGL